MRPRTTPLAAYRECAQIARQRDAIPTDREIAKKYHISEAQVRSIIKQARKGLLNRFLSQLGVSQCPTTIVKQPTGAPQPGIILQAMQRIMESKTNIGSTETPINTGILVESSKLPWEE